MHFYTVHLKVIAAGKVYFTHKLKIGAYFDSYLILTIKKNLLRDEKRLLQTYHGNKATIIIRLIREKLLSDQTHCIINCYETNGVNQIHQRKMCEHLNISCTICTSQILLDVGQTIARINQSASRRYREVSWWISNHPIVCSM